MPMAPRRPADGGASRTPRHSTTNNQAHRQPGTTTDIGNKGSRLGIRGHNGGTYVYVTNANHIKQRQNPKKTEEGETAPLGTWAPSHRGDELTEDGTSSVCGNPREAGLGPT